MAEALSFNMDASQALLNTTVSKLIENNKALKVVMIAIKAKNESTVTTLSTNLRSSSRNSLCVKLLLKKSVGYDTKP